MVVSPVVTAAQFTEKQLVGKEADLILCKLWTEILIFFFWMILFIDIVDGCLICILFARF